MSNRGDRRNCPGCGRPFSASVRTRAAAVCLRCRYRGPARTPAKWRHTEASDTFIRTRYDGRVRGRVGEIAAALGWPEGVVTKRARALGLCYSADKRPWKKEEEAFLLDWVGDRRPDWIARKLGRTLTAVVLKLKRLRISRRTQEGYTCHSLCLCFGVDHHVVERWVREGRLRIGLGMPVGANRRWKVKESEVVRFVRENPMVFRLDKVDQAWFLDLFVLKGRSLLSEAS